MADQKSKINLMQCDGMDVYFNEKTKGETLGKISLLSVTGFRSKLQLYWLTQEVGKLFSHPE